MVENSKVTVQKHPPEPLVWKAAMDDDWMKTRSQSPCGTPFALDRTQQAHVLAVAAQMSDGTDRVGAQDEERAQ